MKQTERYGGKQRDMEANREIGIQTVWQGGKQKTIHIKSSMKDMDTERHNQTDSQAESRNKYTAIATETRSERKTIYIAPPQETYSKALQSNHSDKGF